MCEDSISLIFCDKQTKIPCYLISEVTVEGKHLQKLEHFVSLTFILNFNIMRIFGRFNWKIKKRFLNGLLQRLG